MSGPSRSWVSLSDSGKRDAQCTKEIETATSKENTDPHLPEDNKVDFAKKSQKSKMVQVTLEYLLQNGKKQNEVMKKASEASLTANSSGSQSTPTGLPPSQVWTQFKKEKRSFLRVVDECGRFRCIWCKSSFTTSYNLSRHLVKHRDEKKKQSYPCRQCGVRFNRADHLKTHLISHSNERPYSCSICNRKFKHKCHLTVHIKHDRCFKYYY